MEWTRQILTLTFLETQDRKQSTINKTLAAILLCVSMTSGYAVYDALTLKSDRAKARTEWFNLMKDYRRQLDNWKLQNPNLMNELSIQMPERLLYAQSEPPLTKEILNYGGIGVLCVVLMIGIAVLWRYVLKLTDLVREMSGTLKEFKLLLEKLLEEHLRIRG